jgi:hypothetical protein
VGIARIRRLRVRRILITDCIRVFIVAAAMALGASLLAIVGLPENSAKAQESLPLPLTGELLEQVESGKGDDQLTDDEPIEVTETCDPDGTSHVDYEVTGVAVGPYPGTFTESGTFTLSAPEPSPPPANVTTPRQVVSFSAEFTINSEIGQVTGTKSAEDVPLGPEGFAGCEEDVPFADAPGSEEFFEKIVTIVQVSFAEYQARIETDEGVFIDRGSSLVLVEDANIEPLDPDLLPREEFATFSEHFLERFDSTKLVPAPITTEECKKKDGGFENFGFKNQGDCVSFVETEGKNEPDKNVPNKK